MTIGAKCDLCGVPISQTETLNVFRAWHGVYIVEITNNGLSSTPYDEDYYVCDNCFEKLYDNCVRIKAVDE